jgi:ribosomal protein S18 acetylase RimI-like enzyme
MQPTQLVVRAEALDQVGVRSDAVEDVDRGGRPFERAISDAYHGRLLSMVETVTESSGGDGVAAAAHLLHDFNVEYDEPAPPPEELAVRLAELVAGDHVTVLLARAQETGAAVGVAVMRVQPSVWSRAQEAYLAELYVIPSRRGQGYGRELITEAMRVARERGADYAFVVTSAEDRLAQRLYEAAGFRRTEGEGGPLMLAYEREL